MKDSSTATERVGRYQLLEPIGGGPNGAVSRAKVFGVAGFERQFAVKRFIAELTAGPVAQALSAAARSYGSLEHPRIARMSEFGVAQGVTFTAVEYVAGLDVFRLLQEAKLANVAIAAGGALALVSQAARAVGYAHGRGLSHLGLAPTNVIVTGDGDVKVTDFGILASTMPARPAETPRLASRVPYLSPEQIAGEATSAATDVFVLGVIAYELVTGQRAYRGDSPEQIAQAILAGPPAEPPLPRPIVRVLQRCLARSPFERFPDARALADALDAALRVAPVPGTRKDVGAQVKTTLERYAQLNEGNVSGMVALNFGGGDSSPPTRNRPEARTEPSPMPTFGPSSSPAISVSPGATQRDLSKAPQTMPGLAPPPIPVPPGVMPPPGTTPAVPSSTNTLTGLAPIKKPPSIPTFKKPGESSPAQKPPAAPPKSPPKVGSLTMGWDAMPDPTATPEPAPAPARAPTPPKVGSLTMGWDAMPDPTEPPSTIPDSLASITDEPIFELANEDGAMPATDEPTLHGLAAPAPAGVRAPMPVRAKAPTPGHNFDSTTGEMSMSQLEALNKRAALATAELAPQQKPEETTAQAAAYAPPVEAFRPSQVPQDLGSQSPFPPSQSYEPPPADSVNDFATDAPQLALEPSPASTMPGMAPPPPAPTRPSQPSPPAAAPVVPRAPASPNRMPLIAGIVLAVGVLGAGGYYAYNEFVVKKRGEPTTKVVMGSNTDVGSGSAGSAEIGSGVAAVGSGGSGSAQTGSAVAAGSGTAEVGSAAVGSAGSGSALAEVGSAGSGAGSAMAGSDAGSAMAGSGAGSGSGAVATGSGAGAGSGAATGSGAGSAGSESPTQVKPSQSSDQFQVTSTPAGARVFIDGAELGKAPLKVPGSGDRHTLAVLLPGYDLYLAEVDGAGVYDIALTEVKAAKSGPGIKIETCKVKNRYYIYVDGKPSGQTCPTDKRIVTTLGSHVVEVYDIVTESRKKYDVDIKDDRLSVRVKIDE